MMKLTKKTAGFVMMSILLTMALAGCQSNSAKSPEAAQNSAENNTPDEQAKGEEASNSAAPASGNSEEESAEAIKEGSIEKEGNVVLKELAFVYNEHTIAISDTANEDQMEQMLGKPDNLKSHTYSADDGTNMDTLIGFTEKVYTYPGLEIKTISIPEGKQDSIFHIEITDPKYTTVRNIKAGDSLDTLKNAYPEGKLLGNGAPDEEDDFRYEPSNYVDVMSFHIKDAKVESIQIFSLLD
ncbi:nucleoid-associated protein YgaU [Paenibacillus amylolyticus]|uniref:Nucleoid-associated protein YgaU n=2 Tax=Paenibacillus amylolyticus TaxID=1451 RepID=A0AAP5H235_PAEAM|nr:nucleoid-associated protein YgaU [Paenibacillus amylolyticus]